MTDNKIFKVDEKWAENSLINAQQYDVSYSKSYNKNEEFWKEQGKRIDWITPYTKVKDVSYHQKDFKIKVKLIKYFIYFIAEFFTVRKECNCFVFPTIIYS